MNRNVVITFYFCR